MKRRFAINILCVPFLVLVVLLGCSKGSETYFPLKEGMTWEYNTSFRFGSAYQIKKIVMTNFAPRELKGKTVTPQKRDIEGTIIFKYFVEDSNGIYEFASQLSEAVAPEIAPFPAYKIKYPIKVGTIWYAVFQFTIESIDEVVTVSAGTFKGCVKIKGICDTKEDLGGGIVANISIVLYDWYAPGVGLIKQIIKSTSDSGHVASSEITMQLESFKK